MAAAGEGGKEKGPGGACELCGAAARVYCGADEATLCWGCDAQVHGANFLVARHARALLCRGCARPTPWRAAGPRLGPTASLCDRCVRRGPGAAGAGGADEEMSGDDEDADGDGEDEDEVVVDDDEEGEGENQVVPWSEEPGATPPPVASSTSSSSREVATNGANAGAECAKVPPLSPLGFPPLPLLLHFGLDSIPSDSKIRFFVDGRGFLILVNYCRKDRPFLPIRKRPVILMQMSPCLFPGGPAVLAVAARLVPLLVASAPRRPERRGHLLQERRPVPWLPAQEEIAL